MNVRFDSPKASSGDLSLSAPIVIDGFKSGGGSGADHLGGNNCQGFGNGFPSTCRNNACQITGGGTAVTPDGFDPTNYSATCNALTPSTKSCPLPRDAYAPGSTTLPIVTTSNAAWSQMEIGNGPNVADLNL